MEPGSAQYMASDAPEQQPSSRTATLMLAALVVLGVVGFWLVGAVAPGELIRPVDPDLFAVAIFVGVLCGLVLIVRMMTMPASRTGRRRGGRADAVGGALILPLLMATACLRVGVQAVAFVGTTPRSAPMTFTIDGFRVNHTSHYLRVRLRDDGRTFSVHVRSDLYGSAERGDTITLPVETGRFGIQRAMVSTNLTDADLHHHS